MASAAACFKLDQSGESMVKIFHVVLMIFFFSVCNLEQEADRGKICMQVFVVAVAVSPNAHAMPCNAMQGEAKSAMTQKNMRDMCDTSEENAEGNTAT